MARLHPFDRIVFDEPDAKLHLSFSDGFGWPLPEPAGALLIGLTSLLARRHARKLR